MKSRLPKAICKNSTESITSPTRFEAATASSQRRFRSGW